MTSPFTPQAPEPDAPTQVVSPVQVPPKRKRGLWIGAGVAGALVLMAAGAAIAVSLTGNHSPVPAPTPAATTEAVSTFEATGVLELNDSPGVLNLDDVHCKGMNGYDDLQEGGQVVITDESGTVIGTGSLDEGSLEGSGVTRTCNFSWAVLNVPAGHQFYGVAVTHRGSVQFTQAQLTGGGAAVGIGN